MIKKLLIVAVVGVLFAGCWLVPNPDSNYEFINNSSYTVTITPNGQISWSTVLLAPGGRITITIPEDTIYFLYSDSNLVTADTSGNGEVVFRNR